MSNRDKTSTRLPPQGKYDEVLWQPINSKIRCGECRKIGADECSHGGTRIDLTARLSHTPTTRPQETT